MPACAQTPASFADLAPATSIILVGTVTSLQPGTPEDPFCNHLLTVRVDRWIKGQTAASIKIHYPGPPPGAPGRGDAEIPGIMLYQPVAGQQMIFFLVGDNPYRVAYPGPGIISISELPAVASAIDTAPLDVRLQVSEATVRAGSAVRATVTLRNASHAPVTIGLPGTLGDGCRFASWAFSSLVPSPPLRMPKTAISPSAYTTVTLQPGEQRSCQQTLLTAHSPYMRTSQPVGLSAYLYYLPPGAAQAHCLATAPVMLTLTP